MRSASSWEFLQADAFRSFSPCAAEVARSIVGRARFLVELATGETGISGETITIPKNPQGLYGIDMSGPPWGSAKRHTLGGFSLLTSTTDIQTPTRNALENNSVSSSGSAWRKTFRLWIRPHEVNLGAPYSRAYLSVLASNNVAGSQDMTATILNPDGSAQRTLAFSVGTTTAAEYATTLYADVTPGWNVITLAVTELSTGSGTPMIHGVTWTQQAKRAH